MSFKILRVLAWTIFFGTSACGLKIGEKPAQNPPITVGSPEKFSCLRKIGPTLRSYTDAKMSDKEINEFFDCMELSFSSFEAYVAGKKAEGYHPNELRSFLEEHFLGDRKISDQLLQAFMELKVAAVGGRVDFVTRSEVLLACKVLKDLRKIFLRLRPLMPVINPNIGEARWEDLRKEISLAQVGEELRSASKDLGLIFGSIQNNYSILSFENLLREFSIFVKWDQHFFGGGRLEDWMHMARLLKGLTVSQPQDVLGPKDWAPFFENGSFIYLQYLRYRYQIVSLPLLYGDGLKEIHAFFADSFSFIEASLSRRSEEKVSREELVQLIDAMGRLDLIPYGLKNESVVILIDTVFGKILGDQKLKPADRKTVVLNRNSVELARAEFNRWYQAQRRLDDLLPRTQGRRQGEILAPSILNRPLDLGRNAKPGTAEGDLQWIRDHLRPLFKVGHPYVFLTEKSKLSSYHVSHSFHNLSIMNLLGVVSRMAFQGFAEDWNKSDNMLSRMTKAEAQEFYEGVKALGIDLKIMDPRSEKSGQRSFLEAKMFTYGSQGMIEAARGTGKSDTMSIAEAMEFVAFLYSGGMSGSKVYRSLADGYHKDGQFIKCELGPLDVHNLPMVNRECAVSYFADLFIEVNESIPELASYIRMLSPAEKKRLSKRLMSSGFNPSTSDENFISNTEFAVMTVVAQYAEAVMTRYNENNNYALTKPELWGAYPTFEGFIKDTLRAKCMKPSEGRSRDVFRYIISEGQMPPEDLSTLGDFIWNRVWWNPALNRGDVIDVFSSILNSILIGNEQKPTKPCR